MSDMTRGLGKPRHVPQIAKAEALSAIERSVTFSSLKSIRDDVESLRTDAYMLNSRISRILEILEPYAKYDEYAFIRDLKQSLLGVSSDGSRALAALDSLIKRGLM